MSLEKFKSAFTITADNTGQSALGSRDFGIKELEQILDSFGGKTFNHGLYRVLRSDQILKVKRAMENAFPEYRGRIVPFAFDWLGRHFVIDLARMQKGRNLVMMLEIGAGEAMEIPASLLDFHDIELVKYANDALSVPFWHQWRTLNPVDLTFTDCAGYKVPLFLGGADDIANLEVIDLDVYVEICGQLRNKIRTLQEGQSIQTVLFGKG